MARASDPASPEKWPCVTTTLRVHEDAHDDRRQARQDIDQEARAPGQAPADLDREDRHGKGHGHSDERRQARHLERPDECVAHPPPVALRSAGGSCSRKSRFSMLPIPFTNT